MKSSDALQGFYDRPWAVISPFLQEMECALRTGRQTPRAAGLGSSSPRSGGSGSIAVLPLTGLIMPRGDFFLELFGGTALDKFTQAFRGLLANPNVSTIVFDVASPGGSVQGVDELAAEIYAARGKKRMVAISDHLMASAAYYLASAADEVVASPSSDTGSIGVISLHLDYSKAVEAAGIVPTFITSGAYKAEGNDLQPLSDGALAFWQQRVNEYGDMFVKAVARNRGVTPKDVRQNFGQGRSFGAQQAKQLGMVDRVASFDETMARVQRGGPAPGALATMHERVRVNVLLREAGLPTPEQRDARVWRERERVRLKIAQRT